MRITRAISDVRPVRSGPPTTATDVRCANTPPLHVRPTATARCPTRGSAAGRAGGTPRSGTRITARPVARTAPQYRALGRVPITAPHDHHVVLQMLGGCEDEVLGDGQAGHGAAARATWTTEAAACSAAWASCDDRDERMSVM